MIIVDIVFWGGREGYQSLLNTNVLRELSNLAEFYKMALSRYQISVSSVSSQNALKKFYINLSSQNAYGMIT